MFKLIEAERRRQEDEICLIASENYVSEDVLKAQGSILTNKYAEGYPDKRYYGGCRYVDMIEKLAQFRACFLFNCLYANVQPHSGSQANQAVYLALCKPGDTILGMSLDAGGHLTHGSKVSSSGKLYNSISYGLDDDGVINYEEIKEKLDEHHPRLLIVGASAYPRTIDFSRIDDIISNYNMMIKYSLMCKGMSEEEVDKNYESKRCYFMVDMAHIAGLVATGLHPSPLPWADVVTTTTHKTLRGPRGGMILTNCGEIAKKIDKAVFPGTQGGPLMHVIAAKGVCFEEALQPEFKQYQEQVLRNIKAMEEVFRENDVDMVSGGSDNHLLLLDLRKEGISGKGLEDRLSEIGIVVNKNAIKGDRRPKTETSGIRIGTPAITTRGAKEEDCRNIAKIISSVIKGNYVKDNAKQWIKEWCKEHPIYK